MTKGTLTLNKNPETKDAPESETPPDKPVLTDDERAEMDENPFGDEVPEASVMDHERDPLQDPAVNDVVAYKLDDGYEELRTVYMIERRAGSARISYMTDHGGKSNPHSCSLVTWREMADLGRVVYANTDYK